MLRYGLIAANLVVVIAVVALVASSFQGGSSPSTGVVSSQSGVAAIIGSPNKQSALANPLDRLSSADIAVFVARTANMPEQIAVTNQADSVSANLATNTVSSANVVSKPQIVATSFKSNKDIKTYVTKPGDTITSIASQFGITSDSVRWSNDLTGDSIAAGTALTIPPITGIVYVVKSGDTPDKIAQRYSADVKQIIAYNDAEIKGLAVGSKIIIANGTKPAPIVTAVAFSATYGSNGYDYGWCTYYAAGKVPVPSNWGNANTWDDRARMTPGWTVSSTPVPGAVLQTNRGGLGHVGYVEAVSEDGTQIKYSDMNGLAGWGRVGYSGWVPASTFPNYIYR